MARKMTKKTISPVKAEYNKQRKRVRSFLSKAKKRGYEFPEDVLPPIPKKVTQASVNRLKKLTPDVLYKKATYTVKEVDLKTGQYTTKKVAGVRGRDIERSAAGRRGYLNRVEAQREGFSGVKERREYERAMRSSSSNSSGSSWKQPDFVSNDEEWYTEDELKVKDVLDKMAQEQGYENYGRKKKLEALAKQQLEHEKWLEKDKQNHPEKYKKTSHRPLVGGSAVFDENGNLDEGKTALQRIQNYIDTFEGEAKIVLQNIFADEISQFGAEAVGKAIAQIPDSSRRALDKMVYYRNSQSENAEVMRNIVMTIRGTVLSDDDNFAITQAAEMYEDWEEY